ncbi:MAG: tetratricopeptide repeat protein [Streptosporangiaceae bacterium]|nr:tetratricopeptide repeat protein [Streptosporangiaceae bacterium]MBV9857494.1 tetratricopeptide repeat protein [Streptosporangiaceae bacterium]
MDVERFGSPTRADPDRLVVREGLYRALPRALRSCGISWSRCHVEDTGDGILLLAPAHLPKAPFVTSLPGELAKAVRRENARHSEPEHMRLRMALHAGEVSYDEHGVTAACINLAFRLLDAPALKAALAGSPGVLALAASTWFFDEVIRHSAAARPASYRPVRVTVKETSTVAWIALPDFPYPANQKILQNTSVQPASRVPHQLPAHTPHFVGRADELARLTSLLDRAAGPSQHAGGTLIISAIGGTAGIGKTALALRWAHQEADRFPDGQLYVNLRGFDPAGSPVHPAEVIRSFLGALGVGPTAIPVSLDAQAALYRSLIAGRRFLLLLDNARDAEQVRPLLPGTETCLVLVTSRSQLSSLAAREGAQLLDLDSLTKAEAGELLTLHLGSSRASHEPEVVDELIERCARLPLALSIVAARAAAAPALPLAGLADELRDARRRLDALDAGDLATNVRVVFSCSYRNLSEPAAQMFRMLGLHPGPDISAPAAASLAGVPLMQARKALSELTRAYLVTEATPGRFTFHDLLRSYAAHQGTSLDTETERQAAVRRMLDHYLHTGHAATEWLYPGRADIGLIAPELRITAEELTAREQARAWCEIEQRIFPAIVTQAASSGFDTHAWQIPWVLAAYFNRQGYLHEWMATLHTALAAARRDGDQRGQALASHELGYAYLRLGSYNKARVHLRHALDLNRELGDFEEQAHNHVELAEVEQHQGRPDEALSHSRQSFDLYLAAGHRTGQARARAQEGRCLTHLGEYQQALACSMEAIAINRELGELADKYVLAETLKYLGDTHHYLRNYPQAVNYYQQALELNRQLGDHYTEADTLAHLGYAYESAAEPDAAQDAWRQAVAILDDLHHPDAAHVLAKLTEPREAIAGGLELPPRAGDAASLRAPGPAPGAADA